MTYAEFIVQFPEFSKAGEALVQAHLDAATACTSEAAFGDLYSQAIAYLAAHMLAMSPFSQQMRIDKSSGSSTYGDFYKSYILPKCGRRAAVL